MNFLCPACRTPLPKTSGEGIVPCTRCGVQIDLTRLDTAPGIARLWPDLDLAGESLGEYKLTRRLAAGGMGVVYEAEGPSTGSGGPVGPCAVKVLSALLAAEPELRTRFRREAAALRAIEHPGVVRILAEGEERGFSWYAMERVQGSDLRARIEQGALPAAEVVVLARRLLETLAVVHGKGFVHRDIKPGNILLSATGPKLCDFGIARFDGSSTLTESAAVLGSLRYMAPEQRLGRTDARSDLYAVGIVLHEALAKGVPGEVELPRAVPGKLRRLIGRLLAERPIDRPADARAALVELDATPKKPIALGLGAVAAICAAAWFALGVIPAQPVTPAKAKDDKVEVRQVVAEPPAANKEPPKHDPPVQAMTGSQLGNQQELPREVLQNVGLAPDKQQDAKPPVLEEKVPPKPLGTKSLSPQLIRGISTKGGASPTKAPPQKPVANEDAISTKRDPAYERKLEKLRLMKEAEQQAVEKAPADSAKKKSANVKPEPQEPGIGMGTGTEPVPETKEAAKPTEGPKPSPKGKKPMSKGKVVFDETGFTK
ncbi:MAG: serine/threonine-protein kinase [Myxococcales bacterium]